jgi:alkylation response protein AidB-like acyl-CoA dehydrogenase
MTDLRTAIEESLVLPIAARNAPQLGMEAVDNPFLLLVDIDRCSEAAIAAATIAERAFDRAGTVDIDGGFPDDDLEELKLAGLLSAPLVSSGDHPRLGSGSEGALELLRVLRLLGGGNLSLGRIYEGHVNAALLIARHGSARQLRMFAENVQEGAVSGVWNAEPPGRQVILKSFGDRWKLEGEKILASGAGRISRPLITARNANGEVLMVLPRLDARERADLSCWKAHGMRASATGTFTLTGIVVGKEDIVGGAGDYLEEPFFSGGAWRFCAVQLGAVERLLDLFRYHLREAGRGDNPFQKMRVAEGALAAETARLWTRHAALMSAQSDKAERVVAYVDLTRLAVERAALAVLDLVQRGVGLTAFMRPHPIERISRDLRTYLRQPGPDAAIVAAAEAVLRAELPVGDLWGS